MKRVLLIALAAALAAIAVAGCATHVYLQPTGGDRTAGTIELSYEYGMLESPRLHAGEAIKMARERCAAWGYGDVRPIDEDRRVCKANGIVGNCDRWTVTFTFQCTAGAAH